MTGEPIRLDLTRAEALVLFEFLARFEDTDALALQDQAEDRVLGSLHGRLQKQLAEPFRPDYHALVVAARERLRGLAG